MNIFTRLYSPNLLQTPQYKNILALRKTQGNITGPEKISRKYTEDINFLAPLNPQVRETYLPRQIKHIYRNLQ